MGRRRPFVSGDSERTRDGVPFPACVPPAPALAANDRP